MVKETKSLRVDLKARRHHCTSQVGVGSLCIRLNLKIRQTRGMGKSKGPRDGKALVFQIFVGREYGYTPSDIDPGYDPCHSLSAS